MPCSFTYFFSFFVTERSAIEALKNGGFTDGTGSKELHAVPAAAFLRLLGVKAALPPDLTVTRVRDETACRPYALLNQRFLKE